MANLMDVFLNFFNKPKFRSPSEKQISCGMDNNLTIGPIELIQPQFEMPTSSLPSEYMNKKMLEKKLSLKKRGGTLNPIFQDQCCSWKMSPFLTVRT